MSGRQYKCKCELSDQLPKCKVCISDAACLHLESLHDSPPDVVAAASCDGNVLRLQFEIKLDVAAIRRDEAAYLRTVLQFTKQFEKIIKDSGLENYLKQT